eukprot:1483151-Rhodomonas_salina.2
MYVTKLYPGTTSCKNYYYQFRVTGTCSGEKFSAASGTGFLCSQPGGQKLRTKFPELRFKNKS